MRKSPLIAIILLERTATPFEHFRSFYMFSIYNPNDLAIARKILIYFYSSQYIADNHQCFVFPGH